MSDSDDVSSSDPDGESDQACASSSNTPPSSPPSNTTATDHAVHTLPGERKPYSKSDWRYGNKYLGEREGGFPEDERVPSLGYFEYCWSADAEANKVLMRRWLPFAKCDECCDNREQSYQTNDIDLKKKLAGFLSQHLLFVQRERMAYALHREQAKHEPGTYLSMIVDGADQSKHNLPHAAQKSHGSDAPFKIKMHLLGVLVHGVGTYAYTCPGHIAQGHNVTIQAIWDTLVHILSVRGKLPKTMFLQLDNTTKSCKGKYVHGFLAMLVQKGVFDKIVVGFLPVGHTHEDIDQFFGCIARLLRHNSAHSRLALAKQIRASCKKFGQRPLVKHWDRVANISQWLKNNHVCKMTNVTAYHQFRIFKARTDEGGDKVLIQARRWPGGGKDDHWGGLDKNDVAQQVFKDDNYPDLLADYDTVPNGALCKEPPSDDVLKKIRNGLYDLYEFLHMKDEDITDCDVVFDLYSTRDLTTMKFNWDKADIASMFALQQTSNAAVAAVDTSKHLNASGEEMIVGKFYLASPAPCDIVRDVFQLYLIKQKTFTNGPQGKKIAAVRAQQWAVGAGQDRYASTYRPVNTELHVRKDQFPEYPCTDGFQAAIRMTGTASASSRTIFVKDRTLAAYYAVRFQGGPDIDIAHDEMLNQHDYESVLAPAPKKRKQATRNTTASSKNKQQKNQ